VLVTDDINGQNRGALAAVRALAARFRPVVTVGERPSLAAASRHCAGTVRLPTGGTPGYADALAGAVAGGGYATFFPASDVAMLAVDDPSAALVDKAVMDERARAAGFACLPTEVFASAADLIDAAGRLAYPVVVKSVTKSGLGNLQARRVAGPEQLAELADAPGELLVQPFEESGLRAVSGVVHGGRLLASCAQAYHRIWPPTAGVASAAVTVPADPGEEARLTRLLAEHDGVFQVQFLGPYLLDVNPRVYGSMALAVAAGANLPLIAADAATGTVPRDVVRARPGVPYRWWEGDLRYVAQGLRSRSLGPRQAAAALRPRRATAQSVERLSDPGPTVSRLVHAWARRGSRR
jgi:hypothetical protein